MRSDMASVILWLASQLVAHELRAMSCIFCSAAGRILSADGCPPLCLHCERETKKRRYRHQSHLL